MPQCNQGQPTENQCPCFRMQKLFRSESLCFIVKCLVCMQAHFQNPRPHSRCSIQGILDKTELPQYQDPHESDLEADSDIRVPVLWSQSRCGCCAFASRSIFCTTMSSTWEHRCTLAAWSPCLCLLTQWTNLFCKAEQCCTPAMSNIFRLLLSIDTAVQNYTVLQCNYA